MKSMNSPNRFNRGPFSRLYRRVAAAFGFLLLTTLACRPVIAIGWPEFLILVGLITFLFWPLFVRVYRILDKIKDASHKDDKDE